VHHAAEAVVVVDRGVLGAAIVPEGERVLLPAKAVGEFRALLMREQIIQQRGTLRLASGLAPSRMRSSRVLVTLALAEELTATSPSSSRRMPADKVS